MSVKSCWARLSAIAMTRPLGLGSVNAIWNSILSCEYTSLYRSVACSSSRVTMSETILAARPAYAGASRERVLERMAGKAGVHLDGHGRFADAPDLARLPCDLV